MKKKETGLSLPAILSCIFVMLPVFLHGLTLNSKNIIFHADETSGSFYVQDPDPANKRLQNLLFNDNPPTSYITLILNDKPYRLNSPDFTKIEYIRQVGDVIWTRVYKDNVEFELQMFITNSSPQKMKDAIMLLITAVNQEKKAVTVGSRYLLDTTYDEQKGDPVLYLSSTEKVTRERLILKTMIPEFIFSGEYSGEASDFGQGLYIFPQVNSLSPESIILGNWKKLADSELDYKIKPSDQFRASQYGSQDAAVGIFFNNISVKPGEKVTFGIMLSKNQKAAQQMEDIQAVDSVRPDPVVKINPQASDTTMQNNNTSQATKTIVITNTIIQKADGELAPVKVITNTIFVPLNNTNAAVRDIQYQEMLQSQIQLMEKMNNIMIQLNTISNQKSQAPRIVTNIIKPSEDMVARTELVELRDSYEKQMKELDDKYKALMEQQKKELESAISGYEDQLKTSNKKKNKVEAVNQLDQTIRELDQKIRVIEELEKLRLDFKTMPQEKLDELYNMLESLEKKLIKIQYK